MEFIITSTYCEDPCVPILASSKTKTTSGGGTRNPIKAHTKPDKFPTLTGCLQIQDRGGVQFENFPSEEKQSNVVRLVWSVPNLISHVRVAEIKMRDKISGAPLLLRSVYRPLSAGFRFFCILVPNGQQDCAFRNVLRSGII